MKQFSRGCVTLAAGLAVLACDADRASSPALASPVFIVSPENIDGLLQAGVSVVQENPPLGFFLGDILVNSGLFRADARGPAQALVTLDLMVTNSALGLSKDLPRVGQFLCITKDSPCPIPVGDLQGGLVAAAVQVPWDGTDDNGAYMGGSLQVSYVAKLFLDAPIPTGAVGPMFRPLAVVTGSQEVQWAPPVNP